MSEVPRHRLHDLHHLHRASSAALLPHNTDGHSAPSFRDICNIAISEPDADQRHGGHDASRTCIAAVAVAGDGEISASDGRDAVGNGGGRRDKHGARASHALAKSEGVPGGIK